MERIKKAIERARADAGIRGVAAADIPRSANASPRRQPRFHPVVRVSPLDAGTLERHRIVTGDKSDPCTLSFDKLRAHLLMEMKRNGWRTLGITSPTPDCGKTTVSTNLSFSIARQVSSKVVLADFDLTHPKIADYLGIHPEFDLSDFFGGRIAFEDTLVDPGIPRLLVAPCGKAHQNATEILGTSQARSFVKRLNSGDTGGVSVFDLPPILTTDIIAFIPHIDCVLLVIAEGMTTKPELEETLRLLHGANLAGVVLNKSDVKLDSYY